MLFYAYMPMLLCDCQSFIKKSYLLTYLPSEETSNRLTRPREHVCLKTVDKDEREKMGWLMCSSMDRLNYRVENLYYF